MQNLRFVSSAVPEILGGGRSRNLKVGQVTQATLPCDLILYFLNQHLVASSCALNFNLIGLTVLEILPL